MSEPIVVNFTYRVIGIDGSIVIPLLDHKHDSKWSIKFMQPGVVGSSIIGNFEIHLHDPGSDLAMLSQDDYDKITEQMRIEGYMGDEIAGDPVVTGIIRERPTKMNDFTIKGADIIILAQLALTGRNDHFVGTTSQLLTKSLSAYKLLFRDKFTGVAPFDLSQYSTNGNWRLTTDPDGKPAIFNDSAYTHDGVILSTLSLTHDQYVDMYADAWFVAQCDTGANAFVEAGVVVAAADENNFILGRGMMRRITATRYEMAAEIWQKTAGSYVGGKPLKSVAKVINGPSPTQRVKVTMKTSIPAGAGSGTYADLVTIDRPIGWWRLGEAVLAEQAFDQMPAANTLDVQDAAHDDFEFIFGSPGAIFGDATTSVHDDTTDGQIAEIGGGVDGALITSYSDVSMGPNASYSIFENANEYTMEAWIKPTTLTQNEGVVMINWGNHGTVTCGIDFGNNGGWEGSGPYMKFRYATHLAASSGWAMPTNNIWYHIVMVRRAGTNHFFAQGVEVGTPVTVDAWQDEREGFSIGGMAIADVNRFTGYIQDVAIYPYALTNDQIASHYTAGAVGPKTTFTVLLNGFDSGCTITQSVASSGKIGLRSKNTVGTSKATAANFVVPSKVAVFNEGTIASGARSLDQTFGNTPYLDRWNIAATTEGCGWRVIRHPFIDSIDFGPQVGNDLSKMIHFREGYDLQMESSLDRNVDPVATAVRVSSGAAQDNSGFVEWIDIDAADTLGLVYSNVSAQNVSDTLGQQVLAQTFAHLQGTPGDAKTLYVTRFIETADKFTIGDFVKVTSQRLNLFEDIVQIMQIDYQEGSAQLVLVGDQYPKGDLVSDMRSTRQLLDQLATGTAALTPSASNGLVYDSKYGSPFILPAWSGYESVDSTHKLRLRFDIPQNLAVLQRTLVSFSTLPFRSGHQTTAASNTSGASSSSSSGDGTGHEHDLNMESVTFAAIHAAEGPFDVQLFTEVVGGPGFLNTTDGSIRNFVTTDESNVHTHNIDHTHSIPALTINNPSAVFEVGLARNVHLYVDSVDVSTLVTDSNGVAGPWDSGAEMDVSEVDITPYIQSGGFHEVQLSSSALGGLKACVYVFGLLKSI